VSVVNPYIDYPQLPQSFLPLRLLSGACSGPCVVIGGGPSAIKTIKRFGVPDCFIIGCNHAIEHYPCDMVICQDQQLFQHEPFKRVVENQKTFVITALSRATSRLSTPKTSGFYYWQRRCNDTQQWKDSDPTNLLHTSSVLSGAQAAAIAHALGFFPIICLGLDVTERKDSYKYGFNHPKWGKALPQTQSRQQIAKLQYEFLSDNAIEFQLVNCSTGNWMPKSDYGKVLDLVQQNSQESRIITEHVWLSNMKNRNTKAARIYESKRELRSTTNVASQKTNRRIEVRY